MKRSSIWIIIGLMSVALVGIISVQATWIVGTIRLNQERFDKNVFAALGRFADRIESRESLAGIESMNGFETTYLEEEVRRVSESGVSDVPDLYGDPLVKDGLPNDRLAALLLRQNPCDCPTCRNERAMKYYHILRQRIQRTDLSLSDRLGDPLELSAMLRDAFEDAGIHASYTFGVYANENKSFIINNGHYTVPAFDGQVSVVGGFDQLLNSAYRVSLFPDADGQAGFLMVHFPERVSEIWGSVIRNLIGTVLFTGIILFCFAYTIVVIFRQKKVSEMKNDFINNMTHEFKTPIATISLAADSIASPRVTGDADKVKRFADIIRQENRRMNDQVEKVLQMALIEKRDLNLSFGAVDLHQVVRDAASNFALQIEQREGRLQLDLTAANAVVEGDRTHIAAMVHNLLDNANKYSPERPDILVASRATPRGLELSVSDHGIGISREARKDIFEKFYRVHTGNLHDVKGFGLGLSYVRAMMQAHHGSVEVDSEPGKGSTFTLIFPLHPDKA